MRTHTMSTAPAIVTCITVNQGYGQPALAWSAAQVARTIEREGLRTIGAVAYVLGRRRDDALKIRRHRAHQRKVAAERWFYGYLER